MSSTLLTTSPVWTAAGWTMLHIDLGRRGHRTHGRCSCAESSGRLALETRYGIALACLLVLVGLAGADLRFESSSRIQGRRFQSNTQRAACRGAWHRFQTRPRLPRRTTGTSRA